jgi:hypothetical protein
MLLNLTISHTWQAHKQGNDQRCPTQMSRSSLPKLKRSLVFVDHLDQHMLLTLPPGSSPSFEGITTAGECF